MTRGSGETHDPLRLLVFHHLFAACAEEMGESLMRAAFSPNIRERRDFSCALFDGAGGAVAQAAHLPVHLGSAPLSLAAVLEDLDLEPGDVAMVNDPTTESQSLKVYVDGKSFAIDRVREISG